MLATPSGKGLRTEAEGLPSAWFPVGRWLRVWAFCAKAAGAGTAPFWIAARAPAGIGPSASETPFGPTFVCVGSRKGDVTAPTNWRSGGGEEGAAPFAGAEADVKD
jgi:hypothetical protein